MENSKIVHFMDLALLSPFFIESFKKISDDSVFYILSDSGFEPDYVDNSNVFALNTSSISDISEVVSNINKSSIDCVIFHFLNREKEEIANKLQKEIKKVWCIWGHDLYNQNSFFPYRQYEKITEEYLNKNSSLKDRIFKKQLVKKIIFEFLLFNKKIGLNSKFHARYYESFGVDKYLTIQSFDAISFIVPKEGLLISKIFPDKKYLHLYSDPTLPFFAHFETIKPNSKNILVGNSAAFTNNHLDTFNLIKDYSLDDRKVIVPLSYGGTKDYIDTVIKKGRELFGENFLPLIERMPLKEYSELLSTCGVAIMNQRRQQSGGNLFHLVGSGVKVFINPNNGFYDYFKKNRISIFSVEDLHESEINNIQPLTQNRQAILDLYSHDHFNNEINKLLKILGK
ncbi:TDP-N-acetylfucosamine:lipid II N-acetylfucosaminyltransferase [Chryseobacterium taklimakanense]|uniref:TDP-N-acetylfucosamine:lipid II N-acetylfucosaminyltransferase n=1 Tax=Chryseobacterium taklimakanense TaxID=536441 RepID=UPI0023F8A2CC|nr:TDP-N-acetylfucosamine:lipid II N-acetylfucosaminyltransferase [Chryseobacterium taklimakanense]